MSRVAACLCVVRQQNTCLHTTLRTCTLRPLLLLVLLVPIILRISNINDHDTLRRPRKIQNGIENADLAVSTDSD